MDAIRSFRDIIAWQKAMDMVCHTYKMTQQLPVEERYGLTAQMRRCVVSVPSSIAEGYGRSTTADFCHHLHVSRGSAYELSTQAECCVRLGYGDQFASVIDASEEVGRILNGLIASLQRRADS